MLNGQYERIQHIPTELLRLGRSNEGTLLLDYLSAKYQKTLQEIQQFAYYTIGIAGESRPDIISNLVYGQSDLWWIICMYNGITNPIYELTVGKKIKIPNRTAVDSMLQRATSDTTQAAVVELL